MGAAENKELVRGMFSSISGGDANAFMNAMADDIRYTIIGNTRLSGTFRGKRELTEKLLIPFAAGLDGGAVITPDNLIADGEFVAMQARGKAMGKNGKPYNNTYCHVFRIVDGKIAEITEYLDTELVTTVFGR